MPNSTAVHGDPTALISTGTGTSSYREDISNNVDNGEVNLHPENQSECDSRIMENNTSGGDRSTPFPPLICLEDEDVDMETWNMLMETQDEMVSNSQSVIQISLGTRHRHGLISCYRHTEITEITTTWRIKVVTQGRDQKESKRYPDCIL